MAFDATPSAEVTARDRMIMLRDFLADLPANRFNMCWWNVQAADIVDMVPRHEGYCGTVACIGGWADHLFGRASGEKPAVTGALLGLTETQASALFYPTHFKTMEDWHGATTAQAVAILDHYLATGEIDWSVA